MRMQGLPASSATRQFAEDLYNRMPRSSSAQPGVYQAQERQAAAYARQAASYKMLSDDEEDEAAAVEHAAPSTQPVSKAAKKQMRKVCLGSGSSYHVSQLFVLTASTHPPICMGHGLGQPVWNCATLISVLCSAGSMQTSLSRMGTGLQSSGKARSGPGSLMGMTLRLSENETGRRRRSLRSGCVLAMKPRHARSPRHGFPRPKSRCAQVLLCSARLLSSMQALTGLCLIPIICGAADCSQICGCFKLVCHDQANQQPVVWLPLLR